MKTVLYARLTEDIKEYIGKHGLAPGDRLPAFPELCELFGVSHATVRAALAVLTREGVLESRPRQGIFVAVPRSAAAGGPRNQTIGLVISGEDSAYEAGLIRGVMEQSRACGYQVIVASNGSDVRLESQQIHDLQGHVEGLVVLPTHASNSYGAFAKLLETGTPWVFVDRGIAGLAASLVATDNELGGYLGAKHLLDCGFTEVFAISAKPVTSIQERIQGFRKALKEAGIGHVTSRVRTSPKFESAVGYALTQEIIAERTGDKPFALFLLDETLVLPCYAALREAGLKIPQDVALVSYDDLSARYFDPPLTAVRQEPEQMGIEAVTILVNQIKSGVGGVREIRLKPQLIIRNSSDVTRAVVWSDYGMAAVDQAAGSTAINPV